jgi:addiction module RelE/StbE family toxin
MKLVWTPRFTRAVRRLARRQPALLDDVESALHRLENDPFHPSLRAHKLKGNLRGCWACSCSHDCRLIFEFVKNPQTGETEILLHTAGTHDEVY